MTEKSAPAAARLKSPPDGFSVRHISDTPFVSKGLRSFFEYRDLGIKAATRGRVGAHVIRARPGTEGEAPWHTHQLDFQMVYVTRGWIDFEYEGVGEVRLEAGSCVHQPPGIAHRTLGRSEDLELIEITLPADFDTTNVEP